MREAGSKHEWSHYDRSAVALTTFIYTNQETVSAVGKDTSKQNI